MENKITVKNICRMFSEITVEKTCSLCKGTGKCKDLHGYTDGTCVYCKNTGKIIKTHIVSNHGWLELKYWIKKFKKE